MNEMQLVEDDETSLFDLWRRLREGWKVVLGMTALGIAAALSAIFMIPPKYEAVAVVQVGVVGQISQDGESHWLEGVQLLSVYTILAFVFFHIR